MRDVASLCPGSPHVLTLGHGREIRARAVVLAMGVAYRRLDIDALEQLVGTGVYYGASPSEAAQFTGRRVVVVGGGNSAGQAAVHLSRYASHVIMAVRGADLRASMSDYLVTELAGIPNVEIRLSTQVVDGGGANELEWLVLRDAAGDEERVDAAGMFVLIGARPHTSWLPDELARDRLGYLVTGTDLGERWNHGVRAPAPYETNVPGIFAVGDVRSNSVKRVASAVGEGSVVIQQVRQYLDALGPDPEAPR
jgi:thioredoxin reductase (NADPH)